MTLVVKTKRQTSDAMLGHRSLEAHQQARSFITCESSWDKFLRSVNCFQDACKSSAKVGWQQSIDSLALGLQ